MRQSNYLFTKGSIVFVHFNKNHYYSYLNGRPLIVVSNPTHIMNTLLVCTTGTQDKPGIEVSFWNHYANRHVGGAEISKIYPYSMMTIHSDQIVSTIGQLDPFIMKELDNAIDFHLGRTMEVPGYLLNVEEELTSVTHNTIDTKYMRAESISSDYRSVVPYKQEVIREPREDQQECIECVDNEYDNTTDDESDIGDTYDFDKICKDPSKLISVVDEETVNLIVSRSISLTDIGTKYNVNKYTATNIRTTLTNFVCEFAESLLLDKPEVKLLKTENLPDYAFIGMALIWAFSASSNVTFTKYEKQIEDIIEKYSIDTDNKRTWRSVQVYHEND